MIDIKYEYTKIQLISGNLALLLWIVVASLAFWFYNPLAFWFFLLFAAFMVFAILRRLGCSTCAYCKSCTMGFGRLSAWFFGKRSNKDLRNKDGLVMVAIIYCLIALTPTAILVVSLFQAFTILKFAVFIGVLVFSLYSVTTWRKGRQTATAQTSA
ncbi:hypothetical protein G4O51_02045 [Candidatus Bathyarchaeota archaeon A05DMB-2]|jgi:hypothetical protein|nr:hypothetical protein [Candidatus Bathyarchaeota archaeon A05DMB-2]